MKEYRLDKSKFKHQSVNEAEDNREYWLKKTPAERLAAAWYLISQAYQFDVHNPPRLDRTKFSIRKFDR